MTNACTDLCWIDLAGRPRAVRVPDGRIKLAMEKLEISSSAVTLGVVSDGGDLFLRPAWDEAMPSPWDGGLKTMVCDLVDADGQPSALCGRSALRRITAQLDVLDARAVVAAEMEFTVYDPEREEPGYEETDGYGVLTGSEFGHFLNDIQKLAGAGIAVESCHAEYGPGQFEVSLRHKDALRAMDEAVLLRSNIGEIARRNGMRATFMAKPWSEHAGNGMHIHQSLWRGERNIFATPEGELSTVGRSYLAGLLTHLTELTALGSPTPNSFRRRQPASFVPTNVSWGEDNRTVAVRVLTGNEATTRIEQRDGAADCNPYFALVGQIAAGLEGVRAGLEPPPPVAGNAAELDLPALPRSLESALGEFARGTRGPQALGRELFGAVCRLLERELEADLTSVADWERRAYLTRI